MNTSTLTPLELLRDKLRAAKVQTLPALSSPPVSQSTDRHGAAITYNAQQQAFIDLAASGASCVLIGAAGTGKTTCQKGVTQALIQSGRAGVLVSVAHNVLQDGAPGIVINAFTRRAVANIRKNLPLDLQRNALTVHALLEYQPEYYEEEDSIGNFRKTMRFAPRRSPMNPLPVSIRTIIIEEASMLGTDLFKELWEACPHEPQLIFLGDIQQLPPVFGPAILGFKMNELPTIELTEVYRQALESPILSLAHRIISGVPIPPAELTSFNAPGKLKIHPWKKKVASDLACTVAGNFFRAAIETGDYNPDNDMILLPFNKSFGTIELNKTLATCLARRRGALVHEVIAGFSKLYFSVGDRILVDKEDAYITDVEPNLSYQGAVYAPPSLTMDYWGHDPAVSDLAGTEDFDLLLANSQAKDSEDRVRKASHRIHYQLAGDRETTLVVDTAADVNSILLAYALTVHKAQGSEWDKVFFVMHNTHAVMNCRELLYTAVTRAKQELVILCEPDTFQKGIANPKIKGETLAEKAEYFKGKQVRDAKENF